MKPPIFNARVLAVDDAVSPMPSGRETLMGWLVNLGLTKIVKRTVGARTEEVEQPAPGQGVWQPLSLKQLELKPEGERSWRWFMIHATTDLVLDTDDVVVRRGARYRVMADLGWDDNGFKVYHVVNAFDAQGGGR